MLTPLTDAGAPGNVCTLVERRNPPRRRSHRGPAPAGGTGDSEGDWNSGTTIGAGCLSPKGSERSRTMSKQKSDRNAKDMKEWEHTTAAIVANAADLPQAEI